MMQHLGVPYLPGIVSTAVTALVAYGAWRGFQSGTLAPSILLFEVFYSGTLALWPFVNARHLYPLLPFLFVQLLIAVHTLANAAAKLSSPAASSVGKVAAVTTCTLLIVVSLWKSMRIEDSRALTGDLRLAPTWLANHTPADAVVMAPYPQTTFMYSQRTTIRHAKVQSVAELENALIDGGVDYLVLEPDLKWRPAELRADSQYVRETLAPMVAELTAQGRLALAYEAPAEPLVRVYRVTPRPR